MKSPSKIFSQFESFAQQWINELDRYTEEQFLRKPSEDEWSLGQVYVHLIQSTKFFHLKQIELCATNRGTIKHGGKKIPGIITYTIGMIPPRRIKVPPSPQYTPKQPSNKEEVAALLHDVIPIMKNAIQHVEKASLSQKIKHPGLGYLNAREWYQLIAMHYHHHLRQKSRLDKFLGVPS